MSRWSNWGWYTPKPKKPPPAHGIKVKKLGTTWWGERWIQALGSVLQGDAARLSRGRTYARAGRVHDLEVHGGEVRARVTGSAPRPYQVSVAVTQLADATWRSAIAGMAAKAQFASELLAGQMPKDIDEVFRVAGASLFPAQRKDLATRCSCPDWGDPCKHVAATHYVLGEALDGDPFLLFELRGRGKEQVLDALRAARTDTPDAPPKGRSRQAAATTRREDAPAVPAVSLGALPAADYDRPRAAPPAMGFAFDLPTTHGAILRQLGVPAPWEGEVSPADLLVPLVRAAAERARAMAMAEAPAREADEGPAADPLRGGPTARARATARRVAARARGR